MNDYFLRILIRQRHEEIFREFRAVRRQRRRRQACAGGVRENSRRRPWFFHREKKLLLPPNPALNTRTGI